MRRALLLSSIISILCLAQTCALAQGSSGTSWHHLRLDDGFLKRSSRHAPKQSAPESKVAAASAEKESKAAPVTVSADPLAQAQGLVKANKVDDAISVLNAAIKTNPSDVRLLELRAHCYLEIRQTYQALHDLDQAISLKAPDMMLYRERANVYFSVHDYAHCLEDLDKVSKNSTFTASDYFLKAGCYASLDDPKQVIELISAGLKLAPANADAYYMRAKAYLKLNQRQLGDADFDKAVALEKKH